MRGCATSGDFSYGRDGRLGLVVENVFQPFNLNEGVQPLQIFVRKTKAVTQKLLREGFREHDPAHSAEHTLDQLFGHWCLNPGRQVIMASAIGTIALRELEALVSGRPVTVSPPPVLGLPLREKILVFRLAVRSGFLVEANEPHQQVIVAVRNSQRG